MAVCATYHKESALHTPRGFYEPSGDQQVVVGSPMLGSLLAIAKQAGCLRSKKNYPSAALTR